MVLSLKDFLTRGFVPEAPFGSTRAALEEALSEPEATGGGTRKRPWPTIWKYEDIEFHFDQSDGLTGIFLDRFSGRDGAPKGWRTLRVAPWVILEAMPLDMFRKALDQLRLNFRLRPEPSLDQEIVVLESGVRATFQIDPEEWHDSRPRLAAVGRWV